MHPLPPPSDPHGPKDYSRGRGDELLGVVLVVLAGLAVWRFGFWLGIGIFLVGFALVTFVGAFNQLSADSPAEPKRKQGRAPWSAQLHAVVSSLLASFIGYGVTAQFVGGASGRFAGIAAASCALLAIETAFGWISHMDWTGALGSWCLFMLFWMAASVPLAAWLAPGYTLNGVGANFAAVVLVYAANMLVWLASPWRSGWRVEP